MKNIPFQHELRPAFPNIYGAKDYREFRDTISKMDKILTSSGLEEQLISGAIEKYVAHNEIDCAKFFHSNDCNKLHKHMKQALRCNIARHLSGESYRAFSIRITDSEILQWFTGISSISKSSLERCEKYFDNQILEEKLRKWLSNLSDKKSALKSGLKQEIDCSKIFMDSTCIKANIHFPTDWVLLRDATRSLVLAIKTIRSQGLKHRMIEPSLFLKQMNKMCIEMTHVRRKVNSQKKRKLILRTMKKLSICIAKHGERYRDLLNCKWEQTEWSRPQAEQVLMRIDNILEQLPKAIKQAHDRIIGGRKIKSKNKILSLYDKDAQVIVRGKAGNEVEFGQSFLLAEQANGIVVDWELFVKTSSDNKLVSPTLNRIKEYYDSPASVCADRGFSDKKNETVLKEGKVYNAICPRSPKQLRERLSEPLFVKLQTRRSQTEARIGIFKNLFLGKPLRSRETEYKRIAISWSVLTHNLWLLARMALADEKSQLQKVA